jgi:MtN3 and saliva related transmembrane protein
MNLPVEQIVGISAGVLTSSSLVPQLIKMIKNKEAEDVSAIMLIVLILGIALWIVYGIMKSDLPIIVTNSFSFLINSLMIFFRFKYAKK